RISQEDVDAQASQPPRRVMFGNPGADLSHPLRRRSEVDDGRTLDSNSKPRAVAELMRFPRRAQQPLRRNAAKIETIAAEQLSFYQRHLGTQARGPHCPTQ